LTADTAETARAMIDRLRAEALKVLRKRKPPNRHDFEAALQAATQAALAAQKRRLLALLGDPPNPANVPESFWADAGPEMSAKLRPVMREAYLAYALDTIKDTGGFGVDWSLVNRRAVAWSNQYAYDLVKGITHTTRDSIDKAISRFFETPGQTRADLEAMLAPDFGEVRASMIAVTETTRAASEGQQAIAAELEAAGIHMTPIWNTLNDELVCPICGPKNGNEIADGEFPPSHVNCRCFATYELPHG
jgi:hypothetical protein